VRWLDGRVDLVASAGSLNGAGRTVRRWRHQSAVATLAAADEVLIALGLFLFEIPDEIWIDEEGV
jgi:hypothetical protein